MTRLEVLQLITGWVPGIEPVSEVDDGLHTFESTTIATCYKYKCSVCMWTHDCELDGHAECGFGGTPLTEEVVLRRTRKMLSDLSEGAANELEMFDERLVSEGYVWEDGALKKRDVAENANIP